MKKMKLTEQTSSLSPLTHEEMQSIGDSSTVPVGTCKCDVYIAGEKDPLVFIDECYKGTLCSSHCDAIAATYDKSTEHIAYFMAYSDCPGSPFCTCGSDCKCPHKGSGSGSGSDDSDGEQL